MAEMAERKLVLQGSLRARVSAHTDTCSDIVCFVAIQQRSKPARNDSFIAFAGPSAADKALDLGLAGTVNRCDQDTAFTSEGIVLKSTGADPLYVLIQADGSIVAIGGIFNIDTVTENLNLARYLPN
jgi:hypothetical protein